MKKFLVLAIAILVLAGSVRAGTLTLVKPNGGETWAPGSDRLILWTAVGISGKRQTGPVPQRRQAGARLPRA